MNTLIVGAGISGLTLAWSLTKRGLPVQVWEARQQPGGAIRTLSKEGYLIEAGPNSLQNTDPAIGEFIRELGLEADYLTADRASARRYILLGGKPVPTPSSPLSAITTPLLSFGAKLRILREPWIPKRTSETIESLGDMVRRRLGPEPLENLINPMVGGIYAGNPDDLAVKYAFPKLWKLEQDHGSFIRGAFRKKAAGPKTEIISFTRGLQSLPDRLSELLVDRLMFNHPLETLERDDSQWIANGQPFDQVILTSPPHHWPTSPVFAKLPPLQYAPVISLSLGFRVEDIGHPIDGFGMLIPEKEKRNLLGVLFPSAIFPGRAPQGHHLLTCFIGGSRQPDLTKLADAEILELALTDLRDTLSIKRPPTMTHLTRWEQAIPQYDLRFGEFLSALDLTELENPGLRFSGNFRQGIGLDKCILAGLA
ncbi:MAG: protoporphyrinogen oxidase [Bacteroidota bacterium]